MTYRFAPRALVLLFAIAMFAVAASADPVDYAPYANVLKTRVDGAGMVDYAGLKANRADLDAFAKRLAGVDEQALSKADEKERIAFWINAYNALTLVAIVDHYPIASKFGRSAAYPNGSIRQIPGVWKKLTFPVAGSPLTLDAIEHEILRGKFDEPRIHMALVCAAMSCPPLRQEPYRGETLDAQLADQSHRFVNSDRVVIDRAGKKARLSSIFRWFGADFVPRYGTNERFNRFGETERAVLAFVSRHASDSDRDFLRDGGYAVQYLEYDWSLNERR